MGIKQNIKDLKRFKEIISIFFKYDLGFLIKGTKTHIHLPVRDRLDSEKFKEKKIQPIKLRKALEELGGGFVKLAQILSLRPDLIPKEFCEEFSKLQHTVKPFDNIKARKIVEKELKKPLKQIFSSFDLKCTASASIAQSYKARLKSGKKVLVKVQRPDVEEKIKTDIDMLYHIASLIERYKKIDFINLREILEEVERYTKNELNFEIEANNIQKFYKKNKDDRNLVVSKIHYEYTTKKVLVMNYINGKELTKVNYIDKKITEKIVNSIFKQVFVDGFFHADPHPGNILVVKDKVAFVDFGIMGTLTETLKEKLYFLFESTICGNSEKMSEAILKLGVVNPSTDEEMIKLDLEDNFSQYYEANLNDINFSEVFHKVMDMTRKDKIRMPADFVLLGKSVVTIESLAAKYNPSFNLVNAAKKFVKKQFKKSLAFKELFKRLKINAFKLRSLIKEIPEKSEEVIRDIKQADESLKDIHSDIKTFTYELDKSSNRVTYGLILTGLLISSSLLMDSNRTLFDILISKLFLIGSGVMIFIIIFSIIREKRLK
jgi:ubiquinone biosynthesis protein